MASIVTTKLATPALPAGYLARPRLDALWQAWHDKRLVTVTAGAGFGKTSFLAAAAGVQPRPLIWYALDRTDGEAAVFQKHLAHACGLDPAVAGLSHGDPGELDDDAFLAALVGRLHDLTDGALLVLDDVQLLGAASPVLELINRILRYLPPQVTLVLASREPVAITRRKLQAQGALGVCEAADLRFTADETQRLFAHRFPDAKLDPPLAEAVVAATEGWAAGLEIFFQFLPGVSTVQIETALDRFRSAGASWFEFFTEEVVAELAPDQQDFLHRTSILPRLEPGLCDRLLGRKDSKAVLTDLCRRNLFTFESGDEKDCYRYHHLFQEFLQNQLPGHLSAGEIARLRQRAGRALHQGKHWTDALDVLSRGDDPDAALDLIERRAEALLAAGRYDTLQQALERLPRRKINRRAEALYLWGYVQNIRGEWGEAEALFRQGLRCDPTAARRAELQSLIAQLHMRVGRYDSCLRICRRALAEKGAGKLRIRGRLLGLQGVACCALGRLDQGQQLLNEAIAVCRRGRHRAGEGRYLFLLAANVLYIRSEYRRAEETARRALGIFQDLGDRRLVCHAMGVLGFVQAASGQVTGARSLSEDALLRAENLGYRNIVGYCHLTLGQCSLQTGDAGDAARHYDAARAIGDDIGEVSLTALALAGQAQTAVSEGDRRTAARLAARAHKIAEANQDLWSMGQAALARGLAAGTDRTADRHWTEAERVLRRLDATVPLTLIALWRLDRGIHDSGQRNTLLANLLTDTATPAFDFLFLDFARDEANRVLPLAVENLTGAAARRASDLLTRLQPVAETADEAAPLSPSSLPPLHIASLGPLEIRQGDRLLTLKDWKSARALKLLQLLLTARFRWQPREVILEALWPEAEPRKAANNLRQTVHLLRRVLSGGDTARQDRQADYIQLRNEAYRLDVGPDGSYDVLDFEAALRRAETARRERDHDAVRQHLARATALYRGLFLAECPYTEFADQERENLRFAHRRAVNRLLELYATDQRWDDVVTLCRRAMELNPYQESYQEYLLRALLALGHKQEALATYNRYEAWLAREMDLLPAESLKKLAEKAAVI